MLPRLAEHTHRRGAGSHQVAHGLMRRIRNPHGCQLAAPVQLGQHRRIAPVGFYPIPGFHRDQRGGHHDAVVPQSRQLSMQAISAGTRFLAKPHLPVTFAKLVRQLSDLIGAIRDDPQVTNLPAAHRFGHCNRIVALCTSSPKKMLSFIRPAPHAMRLGAGPSGATLDRSLPRGGPPVTSEGKHRV